MNRILTLSAVGLFAAFSAAGCGVSKSALEEQIAAAKAEMEADASKKAKDEAQAVQGITMKRIVEIESNFATRTAMDTAIAKGKREALDECDKKLALLGNQLAEMQKKVDVMSMANRGELMKILEGLQAVTVTLVDQMKTQKDSIDAAIKKLEAFKVPELPEPDPK
jgi:hypothetical protein